MKSTEREPNNRVWRNNTEIGVTIALFMLTVMLYAPVRHYQFVNFDDDHYVTENDHVLSGITPQSLGWAFTEIHVSYWQPLTWISHMLDVEVWGARAGGHHLTNVLFHGINAVLLLFVFVRMTGAFWRSAFIAAVFAWHPLHVESVAWVAERKDVLSAFFCILTMAAYLRYVRRPGFGRYLVVLMCFVGGLMSKPMLVTFPLVLLLLDYWPLRRGTLDRAGARQWVRLFLEKVPFLILASLSTWITIVMQSHMHEMKAVLELPLRLRGANALLSYIQYIWAAVCPTGLAVFYPFPASIPLWQTIAAAVLLATLTALAWVTARRFPYVFVGWLWFAGMLVPVLGLVQVGSYARADRYMYLPLVGLSIIAAWCVTNVCGKWKYRRAVLTAAAFFSLAACAAGTVHQLAFWRDSVSLHQHGLAVTASNPAEVPVYPFYYDGLADAFLRAGRLAEAETVMNTTRQRYPEHPMRLNLAGIIKMQRGQAAEAEALWKRALDLDPALFQARNSLAILYTKEGNWEAAREQFERIIESRPNDAIALGNLAQLCLLNKDYAAAQRFCERGLASAPHDPVLQTLKIEIERRAGQY